MYRVDRVLAKKTWERCRCDAHVRVVELGGGCLIPSRNVPESAAARRRQRAALVAAALGGLCGCCAVQSRAGPIKTACTACWLKSYGSKAQPTPCLRNIG